MVDTIKLSGNPEKNDNTREEKKFIGLLIKGIIIQKVII